MYPFVEFCILISSKIEPLSSFNLHYILPSAKLGDGMGHNQAETTHLTAILWNAILNAVWRPSLYHCPAKSA